MSHDDNDEMKNYGTINVDGNLTELSGGVGSSEDDEHKSLSTIVRYCGAAVCITLMMFSCELHIV